MAEVQRDFSATGTSDEVLIRRGTMSISGTFVGTIELQRFSNGGWDVVDDGTFTTKAGRSINEGVPARYRFECTAYTSGTANCEIVGTRSAT